MTDRTFAAALDRARRGFAYFAEFAEPYGTWTSRDSSVDPLRSRLTEQDDIDSAAFDSTAVVLADVCTGVSTEVDEQTRQRDAMTQVWTGQAGNEAAATLRTQVERADEGGSRLETVAAAFGEAARAITDVVAAKASVIEGFLEADAAGEHSLLRIGGRDRTDVEHILRVAQGGAFQDQDVTRFFGYFGEAVMADFDALEPSESMRRPAKTLSADWLDGTFVPDYESKRRMFEEVCDTTDSAVAEIYANLNRAITAFGDPEFPVPAFSSSTDVASVATLPDVASPALGTTAVPDASSLANPSDTGSTALVSALDQAAPSALSTSPALSTTAAASSSEFTDLVATVTEAVGNVVVGVAEGVLRLADTAFEALEQSAGEPSSEAAEREAVDTESAPVADTSDESTAEPQVPAPDETAADPAVDADVSDEPAVDPTTEAAALAAGPVESAPLGPVAPVLSVSEPEQRPVSIGGAFGRMASTGTAAARRPETIPAADDAAAAPAVRLEEAGPM